MNVLTQSRRMLVVIAAALTFTSAAAAASVPIIRYDVEQTPASGFGGWFHVYDGTITDLGRPFGGSASCTVVECRVVNETGGGGTMNDGITALSSGAQLFTTRNDFAGQPIVPKITLYLGGTVAVERILIYGGGFPDIARATVEIGQTSFAIAADASGAPLFILDLRATPLAGVLTDRIVLRGIEGSFFGQPIDQFSIAEIVVETAKGAAEQLADLARIVIGVGPGTSLVDKVNQAEAYLRANKSTSACAALRDFIGLVQAQTGKTIQTGTTLPSQAGSLIASAQKIQSAIGC
jgi:hypothetical protein